MARETWRPTELPSEAVAALGFDTSEYSWSEFETELVLKFDSPCETELERIKIMFETETIIDDTGRVLAQFLTESGEALLKSGKLDFDANVSGLPWLPWRDRMYVFRDNKNFNWTAFGIDPADPIVGKKAHIDNLLIGTVFLVRREAFERAEDKDSVSGVPIAELTATSIEFVDGSIWSITKTKVHVLSLATTLLGLPLVSDAVKHEMDYLSFEHRIEQMVEKNRATDVDYRYSQEEIDRDREDALDYDAPGLSPAERLHRKITFQLGLNIDLDINLKLDGQIGLDTIAATKEEAKRLNAPPTVHSRFFRSGPASALRFHPQGKTEK